MGRKRITLVATILASSIVFLDGSVVNVALPALREDLDAGLASQQWVVEAYLLTLSALILVGGSLGDVLGRRRIFVLGLAGFGVTSAMCAAAPTDEALVVARALQGIAGALLVPASLAILTATFDEGERGAAVGAWTAWTGIGFVIGPLLGGILIDSFSWRWVFAINLPLVAVTLFLTARYVEESRDPEADGRLDLIGAVLCMLALGGPVFALIEQPVYGWGDPLVYVPLVAGLLLGAAFIWWERRAPAPMMPLELFRSRNFSVTNAATLPIYGGLGAMSFFLVLFLQQVAGYSALQAGLALMPITVVMFFLSRRMGAFAERAGPRLPMTAGPLLAGAGLLLFTGIGRDVDYLPDVLPGVLLFSLGLSITVAPLTATVLGAVEQRHAGVASGVNNAVARMASLVAIAAVGAIVAAQFGSALDERLADTPAAGVTDSKLEELRRTPLAGSASSDLTDGERESVGPALDASSEEAFQTGVLITALLVMAGGLIAGAGLRNPRPVAPLSEIEAARAHGTQCGTDVTSAARLGGRAPSPRPRESEPAAR